MGEHRFERRLGENLHGNGVVVFLKPIPEARLVVNQIILAEGAEEVIVIDMLDIVRSDEPSTVHDRRIAQSCEERLHMVRNADAQSVIDGFGDSVFDWQLIFLREASKAGNAGLSVPGFQAKRVEVVDAVG